MFLLLPVPALGPKEDWEALEGSGSGSVVVVFGDSSEEAFWLVFSASDVVLLETLFRTTSESVSSSRFVATELPPEEPEEVFFVEEPELLPEDIWLPAIKVEIGVGAGAIPPRKARVAGRPFVSQAPLESTVKPSGVVVF